MLCDLAGGLVLEFLEVLPACEVFADTSGSKNGVWIYQSTEKGPHALYAAIFLEEEAFNAQFSDCEGNEDFLYVMPDSVSRLVSHVATRFRTACPRANLRRGVGNGR
jgi:hypothetical protein